MWQNPGDREKSQRNVILIKLHCRNQIIENVVYQGTHSKTDRVLANMKYKVVEKVQTVLNVLSCIGYLVLASYLYINSICK